MKNLENKTKADIEEFYHYRGLVRPVFYVSSLE